MVPIIIAVVCFGAGASMAARWLPSLAEGLVGGIMFFVVCGLVGAVLGLVGVDIYVIVKSLEFSGLGGRLDSTIVADGLVSLLRDGGTGVGLAAIVYLLTLARDRRLAGDHPSATSIGDR